MGESTARFELSDQGEALQISLSGDWTLAHSSTGSQPSPANRLFEETKARLGSSRISKLTFESYDLKQWNSSTVVLMTALQTLAEGSGAQIDESGLPDGVQGLQALARAVPARGERRTESKIRNPVTYTGTLAINVGNETHNIVTFLGESILSFGRWGRGKAIFQRSDVTSLIQDAGPNALIIVGIINLLMGVILAFMGAVQLQQFGASIYVANLVALGQTREIAPMMTAIIMAGRTGAAYAAQLGTMQVNEEIDSLQTFGFDPFDFLVLPRMIALAIMMPFLILYADVAGMLGGYLIGLGMLDLTHTAYMVQTVNAIDLIDISIGVVKGSVFGVLVAITGCMRGMQSGRSASAVGDAATSAVVSGIIAIIVATAIFSVLTNALGI